MEKFNGTVLWFNSRSGYGFIEWSKNGEKQVDMFVHFSDIIAEGFRTLKKNQKVEFGIGANNQGRPKAIEVKVIVEN